MLLAAIAGGRGLAGLTKYQNEHLRGRRGRAEGGGRGGGGERGLTYPGGGGEVLEKFREKRTSLLLQLSKKNLGTQKLSVLKGMRIGERVCSKTFGSQKL